jgi:hypothetical protein
VRFHIHAPIPPPRSWVASLDAESPPGHIRLIGATIAARPSRATSAGLSYPVPAILSGPGTDALRTQIQRLLQAFQRCDASTRLEIISVSERLAGSV